MKIINIFRIIAGFIALGLGMIGLILPIWPTTPFVLLAIGCFSSTPKIQKRILKIRIFKEYYESYTLGSGLQPKTVIRSLVFLWSMIMLSCFITKQLAIALVLLLVGAGVTAHILWIARGKRGKTIGKFS